MKRFVLLSFLLVLVLSGCGDPGAYDSEGNYSPKGVLEVGQTVNIDFVQHVEDNEYELGVISEETGRLVWRNSEDELVEGFGIYSDFEVFVKNDIEKSYLERKPDRDEIPHFVLYVSDKEAIDAGSVKKNCGKGCTKEIKTKMID